MITGMDRLAAAIEGQSADRVPVFCNMSDQGARVLGISLKEYYADGARVAEAQWTLRERFGHDNLWSLFYVGKEAELLGCRKIIFAHDGAPNVGEMILHTPENIHELRVPDDLAGHPAFQEQLKCIRILKRESSGQYPICAYVTSSITLPALLMGMEKWIDMVLNGPFSLRDELIEKCSIFVQKEIAVLRNEGVDIIVYANPLGSTDFVPMKFFREMSLPSMERDLRPGGMSGIVYYCGGMRLGPTINEVIERLGIGTYYLSPLEDVSEGKKIVAGRGLTAGVINDIRLIDWTPHEIRANVRSIMEAGLPGGKFLFGTLVMPLAIPDDHIRIMLEAAYEFGAQHVRAA